ncbi:hypothetical protein TrVFT333_009609 [Trichoderma virens FT-333]|nr:hypothetical protein TrVFT333_009609 [Trichoderma virens FT-333]
MRLINTNTFKLEEFSDGSIPPYAILSHTWGKDSEELSFREMENGEIGTLDVEIFQGKYYYRQPVIENWKFSKPGITKLRGCCQQAVKDKLGYAWIDTCCIDKTNLVELSEAINSMFRWYSRATVCYAYLSDVPADDDPPDLNPNFGQADGTKGIMSKLITNITRIPRQFLLGTAELRVASISQRMSWAAQRETKRPEDMAYCLMGIFNIAMPMVYGEGGEQAFFRLQEQIMKTTRDDSILAWDLDDNILRIYLPLFTTASGETFGLLNCGPGSTPHKVVAIPLAKATSLASDEYVRPRSHPSVLRTVAASGPPPELIHIKKDGRKNIFIETFWLYEDDLFAEINLMLVDVEPLSCWDKQTNLISHINSNQAATNRILLRFRHTEAESEDFVTILEGTQLETTVDPLPNSAVCNTVTCGRSTSLLEVAENLQDMSPGELEKRGARNEFLYLRIKLLPMEGGIVSVKPEALSLGPQDTTINASKTADLILDFKQLLKERRKIHEMKEELESKSQNYGKPHAQLDELDHANRHYIVSSTLFQEPLENGDAEVVKLLFYKAEVIAAAHDDGWLPLIAASIRGDVDAVRQLLAAGGVEADIKDSMFGQTALSWASANGHKAVVQLLLDTGKVDVDTQDNNGWSPMGWAFKKKLDNIAWLLFSNGAQIACQQTLHGHKGILTSVAFSHDSKRIISGSSDETIKIWDRTTGEIQQTLHGHKGSVSSVAFSQDSKFIASGSRDNTIKIWDSITGKCQQTLHGHTSYVNSVAFSHDSRLIVSGTQDKAIKIWDITTGEIQHTLHGDEDWVSSVAFSHDSRLIVSGSLDGTVKIWDSTTGKLQQTLHGHTYWSKSVAFSHDSRLIVSGALDRTIKIWDSTTGKLQQTLGNDDRVFSVAISHDSRLIVSGTQDKLIKIWDITTGEIQQTLHGHKDSVDSVAFSHNSKFIVSGSFDKTIKIWDISMLANPTVMEQTR